MAFVFVSQSGILTTVINFLASLTEGINAFTFSLASFIGGAVVNESYLASNVTWVFNSILGETSELPLLMLIQQVMYGFAMLVAPTSIFLLAGLSYLEVDYKNGLRVLGYCYYLMFNCTYCINFSYSTIKDNKKKNLSEEKYFFFFVD